MYGKHRYMQTLPNDQYIYGFTAVNRLRTIFDIGFLLIVLRQNILFCSCISFSLFDEVKSGVITHYISIEEQNVYV